MDRRVEARQHVALGRQVEDDVRPDRLQMADEAAQVGLASAMAPEPIKAIVLFSISSLLR